MSSEVVWTSKRNVNPQYVVEAVQEHNGYTVGLGSYAIEEDAIRRAESFWQKCWGFTEVRVVRTQ